MDRRVPNEERRASISSKKPFLPTNFGDTDDLFGVVVVSEIREDRSQTLLSIEVGEKEKLVVLVGGGADSFLGKMVRIDGAKAQLYGLDDRRLFLPILGAACIPPNLKASGKPLPGKIKASRAKRAVQTNAEKQAERTRKLTGRYQQHGLDEAWTVGQLIQLLGALRGAEKDHVAQSTALKILKHASETGDCSAAAALAAELSADRRARLKIWLAEFSPIKLRLDIHPFTARVNKHSDKSFEIANAQNALFYGMPL
ncbi:hypothetical protein K3172_15335 [Qipengyuania sp. 6B39]|uniref:hypothetical protein n=1 Tax=Qipengyuania proteolytica TaxID=2867239 RepID=UPI001C8A4260|nr:hypothetical protein [Qipengyuania proteolytica]MBX7497232.1 hypothetical protein [Qipengyuania proteolytica]